ncbi:flavodoxin [Candidatus Doolittlea endobia]|uniref:Sulfite reductase [NADPH] flavoprotein alpha-component n=1 Tax=Candidatus Doolittlea endobia TaxID=1778262 RepID=A0A143WSM2_9ENTR|nr:flavodoxin [Candidatus Doolittlea endobia]CUX96527.1 Sulfite reductase [NADPH] flavoprotein alpha-component [Candidatus Doolittlea endobia]
MAQISIFVGTVYGNALQIAEAVKSVLTEQGHQVILFQDGDFQWKAHAERVILIITSTTGKGRLPDNIVPLFQKMKDKLLYQPALHYGIIALGDSSYNTFCNAGHVFDLLLQEQGATRVGALLEIDAIERPEPKTFACQWAREWGALL